MCKIHRIQIGNYLIASRASFRDWFQEFKTNLSNTPIFLPENKSLSICKEDFALEYLDIAMCPMHVIEGKYIY